MKQAIFTTAIAISLGATSIVVPENNYKKIDIDKLEVIYSSEFDLLPKRVAEKESRVIDEYEKSFGFELDDKLYLGLLSSNNQIANAFSTQLPLNIQMNYIGGALNPDYFATKSWIDTLLYHESAHNFQINPKKNQLSRFVHSIVKNSFINTLIIPVFPTPNVACSPFNLEGNAVLNESWHQNGGRLYSGIMRAMATTQALAGYITPSRTYNQHLYFPYGTHNYIVGGFFQLFLAQKYGLDRVNSYFYNFSGQWIPIFTNNIFKETFGVSYEDAIREYSSWLKSSSRGFRHTKGKRVARSKSMVRFTKSKDDIIFLTSNHKSYPLLNIFNAKDLTLKSKKTTLKMGRVFRVDGKFYTLASSKTSPTKIEIALYDENGGVLEGSKSKAIQQIGDKKHTIYFDIPNSFDEPQAYIDGEYLGRVNSSIFCSDSGDIYYFKQDGNERVLYKNKKEIFRFKGWYGFVADVRGDSIYIIANSRYGSTLYRLQNGSLKRVLEGDDVVDVKLLDDDRVLVESIDGDGINFDIVTMIDENGHIYYPDYSFKRANIDKDIEKKEYQLPKKIEDYSPISQMHYSSLDTNMMIDEDNEVNFDLSANFIDPLAQNSFTLFSSRFSDKTIAGAGYDNSAYRLNFGFAGYGVMEHDNNESNRGFGLNLYLKYPIYDMMYRSIDSKISYNLSDDRDDKSPLTFTLFFADKRHFGDSMYLNYGNFVDLSLSLDRGDFAYGAKSYFCRDFGDEWYGSLNVGGAYSDTTKKEGKRGIKIESYKNILIDAINFEMPSLHSDIYTKGIIKAGVGLKKVLNYDKYFFSFPVSLRRESIYGRYNYYNLEFKDDSRYGFNEFAFGFKADLLYFNTLALPFSMEYLYNPDLKDESNFRVMFDMVF